MVLVLMIVVAGAVSAQTTKWVDQINGNDSNDGNTVTTAYASLQLAIERSSSGTAAERSVIYVKNGVYGATGLTNPNGVSTAVLIANRDYLKIQAVAGHYPSIKPTIAGTVSLSIVNCNHLIIDGLISVQTVAQFDNWQVFNAENLTVRHCAFEGGQRGIKFCAALATAKLENNTFKKIAALDTGEALEFVAASYSKVTIQDNFFRDNTRHLRLQAQGGNTISDFVIRRNFMIGTTSEESIRLSHVANVMIENNIVIYAAQQGIFLDDDCRQITIRHNTFYRNRYEGIRTREASPDLVIKNNIFYGNGTHAAIAASVSPLPGEDYNLLFNTGEATEAALQPAATAFGANTRIGIDPLFVNAIKGEENLYLQNNSPAIGMGVELGVGHDIERFPRPVAIASRPDVGAYENPLSTAATPLMTVMPIAHFFGEIKVDASSTQIIVVSNKGNANLQITADTLTGEDAGDFSIQGDMPPFQLAPGATRQIEISFNPHSMGRKSAALEFIYADPDKKSSIVRLSGIGLVPAADDEAQNIAVARNFTLEQNYPNPFFASGNYSASSTTIGFKVSEISPRRVTLQIYDLRGALVKTLIAAALLSGRQEAVWDGLNTSGQPVASGVYLCRLEVGGLTQSRQVLLVR